MPPDSAPSSSSFEETTRRVETEVRRWIASFNDEVVPSLRRDGGKALRAAAQKMSAWAEALDREPRPPQP